jgi:hypothetical protein
MVSNSLILGINRLRSYRAFHRIGHAKFPNGGFALGLSQFSILPQLHQKRMLASKGGKID